MKKLLLTGTAVLLMATSTAADTLNITDTYYTGSGLITTTWTDVPITYGVNQTYDFAAGLGISQSDLYTTSNPHIDGLTRSFWLGAYPTHQWREIVVTDDGIQNTSGYNLFQFSTSGMLQGQANGLQWNEQILVNNILVTSPDQIIDIGSGPYSISAVFDISILPGTTGGSAYNQFTVTPTPVFSVPGPIVGAGAPGLILTSLLTFLMRRRRLSQQMTKYAQYVMER
jgi:hypothetical protein